VLRPTEKQTPPKTQHVLRRSRDEVLKKWGPLLKQVTWLDRVSEHVPDLYTLELAKVFEFLLQAEPEDVGRGELRSGTDLPRQRYDQSAFLVNLGASKWEGRRAIRLVCGPGNGYRNGFFGFRPRGTQRKPHGNDAQFDCYHDQQTNQCNL
jgi:hypothetical protein